MVIEFADDDTCTCERHLETITKWNPDCPVEPHRRLALADLERDVVEAAVASRLSALDYADADKNDYVKLDRMIVLRNAYIAAVDALLTARAAQPKGDPE